MGERFGGESSYYETSRREVDPDVEIKKHLDEIEKLLAKLIEKGGDLPSDIKQAIRQQIQAHLAALGIESLEDYASLEAIYKRLYERSINIPTPSDYPDKQLFQDRLIELCQGGQEILPRVPSDLSAIQVAMYGQGDWSQLQGRGGTTVVDYLYNLGKVMSSELAYTSVFSRTDAIEIGEEWKVENGRHRALTLRILGANYIERKGMDRWIVVLKEV